MKGSILLMLLLRCKMRDMRYSSSKCILEWWLVNYISM